MASDLETLLDMGFEKPRAEIAVKRTGGRRYHIRCTVQSVLICQIVQGALEWLEKTQDNSTEEIATAQADTLAGTDPSLEGAEIKPRENAKSLVCNECQRKFKGHAQAEFHASKTGHVDFAESIEEIAPLTEEEKKAKLEVLRKKLAEKRAGGSEQDKLEKKRNEVESFRSVEY